MKLVETIIIGFDIASIVKSYYNSFNQVIRAFPNDKTSFSEADLEQLPKRVK